MRVLAKRDLALVLSIGLIVPVCSRAQQQTETTSAIKASIAGETSVPKASSNAVSDAPQKGFPLSVSLPKQLADVASVEAVLIPASVAERIFGKEIAHNYAVIELTVSNTDPNASLVLQSVFLDYSQWILSGLPRGDPPWRSLTGNQRASDPWQVASVESRLVRGELLDASTPKKKKVSTHQ
jgi:predicted secreted protein